MGQTGRDAVIVCTKDRPEALALCLESVRNQSRRPDVVMVVDSSEGNGPRRLVESLPGVVYVRSEPGLTHQRNRGVAALPADVDVVHFIDDDVVLESDYFAALGAVFVDPRVDGAGGVVTNLELPSPRILDRVFMQDSPRRGALLPNGRNIMAHGFSVPTAVDWLSGCSMSFRRQVLELHPFDESVGIVGEDVDYALRIGPNARLLAVPAARLEHRQSPVNRVTAQAWNGQLILQRHLWLRQHPERLSRAAFWWSAVGELLFALLGVARRVPSSREHLQEVLGAYRRIVAS